MKLKECAGCGNTSVPQNESIKIDGVVYCSKCIEKFFAEKDSLNGKITERELDPTICSNCNLDFGDAELKKISAYPICNDCEAKIKDRTFPLWVKAFLSATIAIVIFAFFWNWKYYQAFTEIKKANILFQQADYTNAYELMNSASEKVPEVNDIKAIAIYFKGIDLLTKDKGSEALAEFNNCKSFLPESFNIEPLIIQARIGASFDNKEYNGFLAAAKDYLALDSTAALSWTSVASAYACLYAEKGDENAKEEAIKCLAKAKLIDNTSKEMKDYYNMVEYRIDSKRIIRRENFIKEFPNGWTKN